MDEDKAIKKTEYNKLIRDSIPEIMSSKGVLYELETMTEEEYQQALRWKILEEAKEVVEAPSQKDLTTELADLYEVIGTLAALHDISEEDIRSEQAYRRAKRGGFERRLKLLWSQS